MNCDSIVKKNTFYLQGDLEVRVRRLVARDQVSPLLVFKVDSIKEINSFMPILSIRIVLSRLYQIIFFFLEFVYLNLTFTI